MLIGRAPSPPPSVSPSTATARGISRSDIHNFFSLFNAAIFNSKGPFCAARIVPFSEDAQPHTKACAKTRCGWKKIHS
jgi:hypothetical protein